MAVIPESIETLRDFLVEHPEHRPSIPHGPGLGLGGRMGGLASISAMLAVEKLGLEASAVQGSVFRELSPEFVEATDTFVEYKGIGKVPLGHTGMTIRGQFLESLQERIRRNITVPYVADADHIPLKSDAKEDIDEFRKIILEAQDRTLFTIDPHFCVRDSAARPDDKFSVALRAVERAAAVIAEIKKGSPYVIELSIDECPGTTTAAEMTFLVQQLSRKTIPLFSVAPSLGFDKKDEDVRGSHLELAHLLGLFSRIARDYGLILGIHSGDGKSVQTLRVIGQATQGNVWYRVSPDRQRIFFKLLSESGNGSVEHRLFEEVSQRLREMVCSGTQSNDPEFAVNCRQSLRELEKTRATESTADCRMFHDFSFLLVRKFKHQFDALGEEFASRYCQVDLEYIRNMAYNLDLLENVFESTLDLSDTAKPKSKSL